MNEYESVLLFDPNLEEEKVDELLEKIKKTICKTNGEILGVDKWGKRPLAYEIQKFTRANYVLLTFKTEPENIKPLERQYKLTEPIIRSLITNMIAPYSPATQAAVLSDEEE